MRSIDAKKLSMPIEGAYSYGGYYDVPGTPADALWQKMLFPACQLG